MNATKQNALTALADGCYNGACNVHGIINSLPAAMLCIAPGMARESADLKVIIGQITYLLGESCGPTAQAITDYLTQREARNADADAKGAQQP